MSILCPQELLWVLSKDTYILALFVNNSNNNNNDDNRYLPEEGHAKMEWVIKFFN